MPPIGLYVHDPEFLADIFCASSAAAPVLLEQQAEVPKPTSPSGEKKPAAEMAPVAPPVDPPAPPAPAFTPAPPPAVTPATYKPAAAAQAPTPMAATTPAPRPALAASSAMAQLNGLMQHCHFTDTEVRIIDEKRADQRKTVEVLDSLSVRQQDIFDSIRKIHQDEAKSVERIAEMVQARVGLVENFLTKSVGYGKLFGSPTEDTGKADPGGISKEDAVALEAEMDGLRSKQHDANSSRRNLEDTFNEASEVLNATDVSQASTGQAQPQAVGELFDDEEFGALAAVDSSFYQEDK